MIFLPNRTQINLRPIVRTLRPFPKRCNVNIDSQAIDNVTESCSATQGIDSTNRETTITGGYQARTRPLLISSFDITQTSDNSSHHTLRADPLTPQRSSPGAERGSTALSSPLGQSSRTLIQRRAA